MREDAVLIEFCGAATWFRLNRPTAMNALSPALLDALDAAIAQVAADASVRALVVTGNGRAFCAGADLSSALDSLTSGDPAELLDFVAHASATLARLEALPIPVIAAVNGLALAGGLELVLCCDLVVAGESARFGDAHANYGLLPGAGGSLRLPRKIGATRAKRLLFTGELATAAAMRDAGLVNEVVPDAELEVAVTRLVDAIAEKSPLSVRAMKQLVDEGLGPPEKGLRREQMALASHVHSWDLREGLTAFREKRKPLFEGR